MTVFGVSVEAVVVTPSTCTGAGAVVLLSDSDPCEASMLTKLSSFFSRAAVVALLALGPGLLARLDNLPPLRTTPEGSQSRCRRRHRSHGASAVRPMHLLLAREQPRQAWPYGAEGRRWFVAGAEAVAAAAAAAALGVSAALAGAIIA